MGSGTVELILFVTTIVIILLTFGLIILFTIFQGRKNKLLQKQKDAKKQFEKEIAESQIEIREQTLRNISWELHDNIGQLLTLAKIQLQSSTSENIRDAKETISKSLHEVRALSKLINPDAIKNINLNEAVQLEIDRFNRLNFIKSKLIIEGVIKKINPKAEIIIFRILQEFFSNTIKHSKATTLSVKLNYEEEQLTIYAKDNGIGYNQNENPSSKGIGLENMKNRALLINAEIDISSKIKKGTTLKINYNFNQ